jgi:hypothetical protein
LSAAEATGIDENAGIPAAATGHRLTGGQIIGIGAASKAATGSASCVDGAISERDPGADHAGIAAAAAHCLGRSCDDLLSPDSAAESTLGGPGDGEPAAQSDFNIGLRSLADGREVQLCVAPISR